METGFKRLWSRKKSWGAADQPSHQRKLSSSSGMNERPLASTPVTRDGRPSMASSRYPSERPYSRDTTAGPRDLPTAASHDEFGRAKSSHRIQPMLVGISRPETARDRPDTGGSLQNAVQRAGDSVGRRPSDVSASQPMSIRNPQKTKLLSRHVDIFSISGSMPSYLSRYNEEIAERNSDTFRLNLENTPYVYDPASKYQEEVAIRNAYLPYKPRASTDNLRRSADNDRAASMTNRSMRNLVTPQPNGTYSYSQPPDPVSPNQRTMPGQTYQHFRHNSQRSQDGSQLPSIPQESGDEESRLQEGGLGIIEQPSYSPTRTVGPNTVARDNRMHTISEGQAYVARPSTADRSATPRNSGYSSTSAYSDYKASVTDYSYAPPVNHLIDAHAGTESIYSPPSARSATSSVRRFLPNRTIMDLTNDDSELYSDASSTLYSNYSPVIEQAKSDAFQRVAPSQIHTEERRSSKGPSQLVNVRTADKPSMEQSRKPVPTRVPVPVPVPAPASTLGTAPAPVSAFRSTLTPTEEMITPTAELPPGPPASAMMFPQVTLTKDDVDPMNENIDAIQAEKRLPISSTFSPISTVASWSPRSSAYITKPPEPLSMTARVAAALEASRAIAKENPLPVPSRVATESPTVKERVASFESNTDRDNSSTTPTTESVPNGVQTNSVSPSQNPLKSIGPFTKTNGKISQVPSIHMSPESITSADFIDPSNAFGVRARDFAITPRKSTSSLRKEAAIKVTAEPLSAPASDKVRPKKKSTKIGAVKKRPASAKPADSEFDEEAFARKQAEARAAIERLQRSLSEDFITLPDRASIKIPNGKAPESEVSSITPFLVLPSETKPPAPALKRAETDRAPPSSFRTSRDSGSGLASTSRSLSAGSRSSRRAPAPALLKNVEPATHPINQNLLSPALLEAMQVSTKPPKSPGEISLSSFPVPSSSRPPSQPDAPTGYHSHSNSFVGMMKRRNSTKSQASTASAFSIPLHMVPGRTSSVRDPLPEEIDTAWA